MEADDLRATAADIRNAVDGVGGSEFELAVADWLEHLGDTLADDPSDYCADKGHEMWSSQLGGVLYVDCNSWFCQNVDKAFAVITAWRDPWRDAGSVVAGEDGTVTP